MNRKQLPSNAGERRAQATRDVRKKIALENKLKIKLNRFFTKIANQFRKKIALSDSLDINQFQEELAFILNRHYKKTFNAFGGDFADEVQKRYTLYMQYKQQSLQELLDEEQQQQDQEQEDNTPSGLLVLLATLPVGKRRKAQREIRRQRALWIRGRVQNQARAILRTTQKAINQARNETQDEAVSDAIETGVILTAAEVARRAQSKLKESIKNRPETIAMTETQAAAEQAKSDGMVAIVTVAASAAAVVLVTKTWNTIIDGRQRPAHDEADGQTVSVTEPFIVGGQELMQPGDTSRGATIENIANCRCGTTFSI